MDVPIVARFNEDSLIPEIRGFARELFRRYPMFRSQSSMERLTKNRPWSLVVAAPAPSGDPDAELRIWMDPDDEPSVAFGGWHTHESVWRLESDSENARQSLYELIDAIHRDHVVLCEDLGGIGVGTVSILDMRSTDALLEELTSKYSPGHVRLRSWSGRLDREVTLGDLEGEV